MTRLLPQVGREDFRPCVRNFTPINVWNASVSDSPLKKNPRHPGPQRVFLFSFVELKASSNLGKAPDRRVLSDFARVLFPLLEGTWASQ